MINSFKGDYSFLSNMHRFSKPIIFDSMDFFTVEHAYVAAKTTDLNERIHIQNLESPYQVKKYGRTLKLPSYWDNVKFILMSNLVLQKFQNNEDLKQLLLDTNGEVLVEGNTWNDRYWGQCPIGVGENNLGNLLMSTREVLKLNLQQRSTENEKTTF